jgi:hypothetical protein
VLQRKGGFRTDRDAPADPVPEPERVAGVDARLAEACVQAPRTHTHTRALAMQCTSLQLLTEKRPPTQSQNPNALSGSMPNALTSFRLVDTATMCFDTQFLPMGGRQMRMRT